MQTDELKRIYAKRPYKGRDQATGEIVGFNTLVDLRDALSGGHVVRIEGNDGPDPSRNYSRMTTDQVRQLCQVRNIIGFLTMTHEQQLGALIERDRQDDARNARHVEAAGKPVAKKGC